MNLRNQRYVAATVLGFILAAASRLAGADFETETGGNDQPCTRPVVSSEFVSLLEQLRICSGRME